MQIELDELQALTLLAQDPTGPKATQLIETLSTPAAKGVASAIVLRNSGQPLVAKDPISTTAKAIIDWVERNQRPLPRPDRTNRKAMAREWMSEHATAWQP